MNILVYSSKDKNIEIQQGFIRLTFLSNPTICLFQQLKNQKKQVSSSKITYLKQLVINI